MKTSFVILTALTGMAVIVPRIQADDELGSAVSFAVMGNTTVTSTGNTVLNGNLGVYPGTAITGFGPGTVNGTTYIDGTVAQQAGIDAQIAYTALGGESPSQSLTGEDLGGQTLAPGVYQFTSSAQLTGLLTLNAERNPNAQFIFQIGSTLTTAVDASVVLENGAQAGNIFWQVGSSATIGTGSVINGNILANASITLNNGASLNGSALALNGAVTLDDNIINIESVPEANSLEVLVIFGALVGAGAGWGWWRGSLKKLKS